MSVDGKQQAHLSVLFRGARPARTTVAVAVASLASVVAVAALPQLLGKQVGRAFDGLGSAQPGWLWVAAVAYASALVASAWAWRSVTRECGGELDRAEAVSRYGSGSLVNALLPAHIGDAVRVALFAQAIPRRERLWTSGGVYAAVGAARAFVLVVFLLIARVMGALPLWPALVVAAVSLGAGAMCGLSRRGKGDPDSPAGGAEGRSRASHLLDAFRALGRSPRRAAAVLGWITLATLARVAAAAAIVHALGLPSPVAAALVIVPALEGAALVPLTPGNFGVASGAVAMALQSRGIGLDAALSAGIALHGVETLTGFVCGLTSVLWLARSSSRTGARWAAGLAGAAVCLLVATALGATLVFGDLV